MLKFILTATLCLASPLLMAKTVNNLGEIENQLQGKDIQWDYAKHMNGESRDGFASLSRDSRQQQSITTLLKLIGHDPELKRLSLLGVKVWQGQQYIVIACSKKQTMSNKELASQQAYDECDADLALLTLAVVQQDQQGQWQLLAKPYQEHFSDDMSQDDIQKSAFAITTIIEDGLLIGQLDRFDTAAYQLNAQTRAFGVRYSTSTGYAGGGASRQNITLFAMIDGELRPVFSDSSYQYSDIAGNWNEDGTRQHDIEQTNVIFSMSKQQHNGFFDIISQQQGNPKSKTVFQWNPKLKYYQVKK
ncbi:MULTISPECIES: hypothetical protein [unclassified Acinetobacter]|uniref:hypothetical protein n=1 Tax=unclassified Acinetobacter TaxID=196816 RepID=UPI0035B6C909